MSSYDNYSREELCDMIEEYKSNIIILSKTNNKLQDDLTQYKEFFGYNEDTDIDAIIEAEEDCEEEERKFREDNAEYNKKCEKAEILAELVIKLGELQFSQIQAYSQLKTMGGNSSNIVSKRKTLIKSLNELKQEIDAVNIAKFASLIEECIRTELEMFIIDEKMTDISP